MKLFDRLWRSAPTCTHSKSTAARSEIGHSTVRRYYWLCGRCWQKRCTSRIGKEMPTAFWEHQVTEPSPGYITRSRCDGHNKFSSVA